MQVVLKFISEKTTGEVYELIVHDLQEAIMINAYSGTKLEEIRQDLLHCQALISKYQFQAKNRKAAEMDAILCRNNDVTLTL